MNKSILFLLLYSTFLFGAELKATLLTPHISYYVDTTSLLTQNNIKSKKYLFKKNHDDKIDFEDTQGNLWLEFHLQNNLPTQKNYLVEYIGGNLYEAKLYNFSNRIIDIIGVTKLSKYKKDKGYVFKITAPPHSSTEYYMKIKSRTSPMVLKLKLWDKNAYYKTKNDEFNIIFFLQVAIGFLLFYNLMILLFTRDVVYIYYILITLSSLAFSVLFYQLQISAYIYVYPDFLSVYDADIAQWALLASFVFLPWFVTSFLQLKELMPREDKVLKYLPFGFVLLTLLSVYGIIPAVVTFSYFVVMLLALGYVSLQALTKGVKQARYYLFSWLLSVGSLLYLFILYDGYIEVQQYSLYVLHICLFAQAVVLSIALSARVHYETEKKELSDAKLFEYQKEETIRLEGEVAKRTEELSEALKLKNLLFKEIHHRVKNNMQIIISLLRLQADALEDENLQNVLLVSEQRIQAMSSIHEMLYVDENIHKIEIKEYFKQLVSEVKNAYDVNNNIDVKVLTDETLELDHAIYLGLVVNELLTNAFKHAFDGDGGRVTLSLESNESAYTLKISDNGKGGSIISKENSLGLMLVNTLVKGQLKGTILTKDEDGITHTITFLKEKHAK